MRAAAVRCLSFHAQYRCQNSGDCCTSDWPIQDDHGGLLPRTSTGCAFHNSGAHQCEIHAAHGHDALPLACRQFPRVSILEPRGAVVTLSCYCPTARGMLDTFDGPIAIVENAPAFPPSGEYIGLDARTSLPPALCPDVLMDWDSWYEWERLSVELWNLHEPPRQILARLSIAVESTRTWRPGQGELIERVREAFENTPSPGPEGPGLHAFLAAHTFASWTAHLGAGLRTWLRSLETVIFLLEQDWTIAEIDLWLRHYADPRLLADVWSTAEAN